MRAARYVDTTILSWLIGLPIYRLDTPVVLTKIGIIHRRPAWVDHPLFGRIKHAGETPGIACGTQADDGDTGTDMAIEAATDIMIEMIEADGRRHRSRPCRVCFSTGLLVRQPDPAKEVAA